MFDDPKKYLNDLQTQLRQEKYEEELEKLVESPDDFDLDKILGEDAPRPGHFQAPQGEEFPIRNRANGYGTRPFPGQNSGPYEQDWRFSQEDRVVRQDGNFHRPLPGWQDDGWEDPRPYENPRQTSRQYGQSAPPQVPVWPEEEPYAFEGFAAQTRRQVPQREAPEEKPAPRPSKRAARKAQARRAAETPPAPAFDESRAVPDDKPPRKGVGGLWLLFLLEIAGILAIVLWWVRWLL